ncbi:MAG: hypothetical protein ACR2J6_05415 [Thermoleophilaceae bacterium]
MMRSLPTKSILRRRAAVVLLAIAVVAGAAAVSGCGSGSAGNDADATDLLSRAFHKPIESADVNLDGELKIDGLRSLDKPVRIQASGTYVAGGDTIPKVDLDLKIGAQGQGQSVQTGFLSTGGRAFLKFGGEYYEQPAADVAQANRRLRRHKGKSSDKNALGIDPASWIRDAKMQDEEKVGGVQTDHVTARIDVKKLLGDLNRLARKGTNAVGGQTTPQPLSPKDLGQAADTVKDPSFDIYVGKDDGLVHRMSANLGLSVPESDRSRANGITGGSLRFSLDLTKANGGQTIEAPAKSRPIGDLSKKLGGAAALGALGGGAQGITPTTPPTPGTTTPAPSGGGTMATPGPTAFKRYRACLDKAKPGDTQALSRCSALLSR